MSYLDIKNLKVTYSSGTDTVHALNGVSLSLEQGETLGLVGETGAGKTTTALSIMGLLSERTAKVLDGSITFDGQELLSLSDSEMQVIRGSLISMIFQDPMTSLNPVLTVGDQIAEALLLHPASKSGKGSKPERPRKQARRKLKEKLDPVAAAERAKIDQRVGEILELVGIEAKRKNQYPHEFSGGMKQRVVIAMALACSPSLLIADEPTTALDVTIQAQVLKMIDDLKQKMNMSVIMITHDLGIVAQTCDRVAVMYAGEIIESGLWEDFFLQKEKRHPYTEGLFGSIPNIDEDRSRLTPIAGAMPDPTDLPQGCCFSPRCPYANEKCQKERPAEHLFGSHMIKCHLYAGEESL